MKTITLKADDALDATVARIAKDRKKTRSAVIREAVFRYEEHLRRTKLQERVRAASFSVRKESVQTAREIGDTDADGL